MFFLFMLMVANLTGLFVFAFYWYDGVMRLYLRFTETLARESRMLDEIDKAD